AGESQGGFAQHGLARCLVFGRIAGRIAAKNSAWATEADPARTATETLPAMSLAVWDIAPTVAAGERFAVKAGAKSSAGCALGGCRIQGVDDDTALNSR